MNSGDMNIELNSFLESRLSLEDLREYHRQAVRLNRVYSREVVAASLQCLQYSAELELQATKKRLGDK